MGSERGLRELNSGPFRGKSALTMGQFPFSIYILSSCLSSFSDEAYDLSKTIQAYYLLITNFHTLRLQITMRRRNYTREHKSWSPRVATYIRDDCYGYANVVSSFVNITI